MSIRSLRSLGGRDMTGGIAALELDIPRKRASKRSSSAITILPEHLYSSRTKAKTNVSSSSYDQSKSISW